MNTLVEIAKVAKRLVSSSADIIIWEGDMMSEIRPVDIPSVQARVGDIEVRIVIEGPVPEIQLRRRIIEDDANGVTLVNRLGILFPSMRHLYVCKGSLNEEQREALAQAFAKAEEIFGSRIVDAARLAVSVLLDSGSSSVNEVNVLWLTTDSYDNKGLAIIFQVRDGRVTWVAYGKETGETGIFALTSNPKEEEVIKRVLEVLATNAWLILPGLVFAKAEEEEP